MALQYGYLDIELNKNDDISFEDGDFILCTNENAFRQHMKLRLLTNPGELTLHPDIGSGLEALEGMANTRETGSFGTSRILKSINADKADVDVSEITIRPVPTAKDEITFYTYAEIQNAKITRRVFVTAIFKLNNGLLVMTTPDNGKEVL